MSLVEQIKKQTVRMAIIAAATAALAYAGHPKVDRDLERKNPDALLNVIIQYKQGAQQRHRDAVLRKGGFHKGTLDVVKGAVFSVPAKALVELANDPDVDYISPDRPVAGATNIERQSVGAAWAELNGWKGTGVGVAVIDSGVDGLDGMSAGKAVVYSQNFVPGASDAKDQYGHGTHVAGIIASTGEKSKGLYKGLSTGVKIINLRVLDANAQGTDSQVISAIQRAIALKTTYNIRVINLSLGRPVAGPYATDPLCQAVEQAWKAGIVVVVAAGNEGRNNTYGNRGYGTISSPGNDPYAITVGALKSAGTTGRSDDRAASYSSKGPTLFDHIVKPDLLAPGNRVISVKLNNDSLMESQYPQNETGGGDYFILSGTSMATPMVSAAAAVMIGKQPGLTPDQVKARLMKTASKAFPSSSNAVDPVTGQTFTTYYDIFTVGAGYVDLQAALANNDTFTGNALSPTAVRDAATDTGKLQYASGTGFGGANVIWGDNVIWGTNVIWGDNVIWGTNVIWGDNVIWGTANAFSSVWGTNAIWGTSTQTAAEATAVAINGEN